VLVLTRAFFVNNEIYMAFLLNSQAQGVSGKNEQSTLTPRRGAPEARGPMQLHWLKAGPDALDIFLKRWSTVQTRLRTTGLTLTGSNITNKFNFFVSC